jgi:hypothetical protein
MSVFDRMHGMLFAFIREFSFPARGNAYLDWHARIWLKL